MEELENRGFNSEAVAGNQKEDFLLEEAVEKLEQTDQALEQEDVSLEEKMAYVEDYARSHPSFSFRALLEAQSTKMEVIVTFLSILELMKLGKSTISQEYIFDDIKIESRVAA